MMKINKKGLTESQMIKMILAISVLGVCLLFLYGKVLHGAIPTMNNFQQCGALTMNNGQCKDSCDPVLELDIGKVECKDKTEVCCVRKNQASDDVILPAGYGGDNTNYDYKVLTIDFADGLPQRCTPDGDILVNRIVCEPGYTYKIPIEITVKNTYKSTKVFADPVVVINGEANNMIVGKYPGSEVTLTGAGEIIEEIPEGDDPDVIGSITIPGDAPIQTLRTDITIASTQTKKNDYWEVYPYVKCVTKECMTTDTNGRGILNYNDDEMLTISFEKNDN